MASGPEIFPRPALRALLNFGRAGRILDGVFQSLVRYADTTVSPHHLLVAIARVPRDLRRRFAFCGGATVLFTLRLPLSLAEEDLHRGRVSFDKPINMASIVHEVWITP